MHLQKARSPKVSVSYGPLWLYKRPKTVVNLLLFPLFLALSDYHKVHSTSV